MDNVSRPLIALLLGTVAFFALWIVALRPSSSSSPSTPTANNSNAYLAAVAKAKQAVATSNAASAAHGGSIPGSSSTPAVPAHGVAQAAVTARKSNVTPRVRPTNAQGRLDTVQRALAAHKVLALLFYNPTATDDRAVRQELDSVPASRGRVVKLPVPLSELVSYTVITNQVPVNFSPTLVIVDRAQKATEIVGFADRFEIAQRIADALATR